MLTLLPLLGLSWILSLLVPYSVVFHYFFVIANTVQGMCIFFLHCICNEEVSYSSAHQTYSSIYPLQYVNRSFVIFVRLTLEKYHTKMGTSGIEIDFMLLTKSTDL